MAFFGHRRCSFAGSYSCLTVELTFKREFSYYLLTIYVPCCMLVIVSWVSFWLDPNAVPARVSLGVTTLLTMSTQTASINNSLPPVAYTKAIDVWTGVSIWLTTPAYLLSTALIELGLAGGEGKGHKGDSRPRVRVRRHLPVGQLRHRAGHAPSSRTCVT